MDEKYVFDVVFLSGYAGEYQELYQRDGVEIVVLDQKSPEDMLMFLVNEIPKYERPCLVLDGDVLRKYQDLLKMDFPHLMILNCFVGVSSYGNKFAYETKDIDVALKAGYQVMEAYDFQSFMEILNL